MPAFNLPTVTVPKEIWVVIDDYNEPCFTALDKENCIEHVKQAVEYYFLEEAEIWKIVQYREVEVNIKD